MKISKHKSVKCVFAFACALSLISTALFGQIKTPTHPHVSYGPEDRQWLNLYLPSGDEPAPVFLYAHHNAATADNVKSDWADSTVSAGIAIVSWESIAQVKSPQEALAAMGDADMMFDWVKDNAGTYNLDVNNIIIGGQSRGSGVSLRLAHSQRAGIVGIYMGQAYPGRSFNERVLEPITKNSPPIFLAYRAEPGVEGDGHDPAHGQRVVERYKELGIGDRAKLVHSLNDTSDNQVMQFVPKFVRSVVGTSVGSPVSNTVPADEIDWGWRIKPTFPNEAYGLRVDVNPELTGDNHLFDVWVPGGEGPYPAVIYAHGGAFNSGDKIKAIGNMPKLAGDSIVFISINYTLKQGPQRGIQDGINAVDYIVANSEKYKIDPNKIFLSGNSSGGIMMNHIIFDRKTPGIIGAWHGAYHKSQFADLSVENLREVGIPIGISMGHLYPEDKGHSALAAVTLLEKNVAAGNSGMWIGKGESGAVAQVWLDGEWIKNTSEGIDTGESYPSMAEWIHAVAED